MWCGLVMLLDLLTGGGGLLQGLPPKGVRGPPPEPRRPPIDRRRLDGGQVAINKHTNVNLNCTKNIYMLIICHCIFSLDKYCGDISNVVLSFTCVFRKQKAVSQREELILIVIGKILPPSAVVSALLYGTAFALACLKRILLQLGSSVAAK